MRAAGQNENPEMILMLLDSSATLRDGSGNTAFDHAQDNHALRNTDAYWRLNDAHFG